MGTLNHPLFSAVGSVSGSLWYDGFLEWMKEYTDTVTERYYFSPSETRRRRERTDAWLP